MDNIPRDLSLLDLPTEFRSLKDNLSSAFFSPCLERSTHYKRAVGYFRSSVYRVIGTSLVEFSRRGGKTQLICSPTLSLDDIKAIATGYAKRSERIASSLQGEIDRLLDDPGLEYPLRVLATLVATNCMDIRLAIPRDGAGIYHEKLGIFSDSLGNQVSFKGSSNETWNGLSTMGNFESIEVFCSWRQGLEAQRVRRHDYHFDTLWSGSDPQVTVLPIPHDVAERLENVKLPDIESIDVVKLTAMQQRRTILPHQQAAIDAWRQAGCKGVLKHATGSGKTFTAIAAIHGHVTRGQPALILVPSQLLLEQWAQEIQEELPGATILLAGGGYDRWRLPGRLRSLTSPDPSLGQRVVVATMHTAASQAFLERIYEGPHLLLVADEVHRLGSPSLSQFLTVQTGPRLGLSATPERYGDPEGTLALFEYFGEIVPPVISLADAIKAGRLVDYEYLPHTVNLTDEETEEWNSLTTAIGREIGRTNPTAATRRTSLSERAKLLLIQRSRIAKKAQLKTNLAKELLTRNYQPGQHWLVYCEDQYQLRQVVDALEAADLRPLQYHSAMDADRIATLDWFKAHGGILVSIRCLDEGIDIPAVSHALILASSQNPRQFIQRRGRVLRKAPGKTRAVIHDAFVIPNKLPTDPVPDTLIRAELVRATEFATHAANPSAVVTLRSILIDLGIDPDQFITVGVEEEEI